MKFVYSDGGRSNYYKAKNVGDCVTRAICNATGRDYKEVYSKLKEMEKTIKVGKHERAGSVRNGVRTKVYKKYIEKELGLKPLTIPRTMALCEECIPSKGTYIVAIAKHLTCIKDGDLIDTYNCAEKKYYNELGQVETNNHRHIYMMWKVN